jgi:hypothetical protein
MFDKLKSIMKTLGLRGEDPLKTRQELINFIDGRAAFVSQVTLIPTLRHALERNIQNYLKMPIF